MKIVLFGKGGQVGWELQRSLSVMGTVVALEAASTDYCGDLTQLQGIADTLHQLRPGVIVNAAAHTAVDKAEGEPELARTINALAPEVMAGYAQLAGALLVHYSTDYVFDGRGQQPWQESDAPAPLNVYGRTKLEGEQLIQASACQHLVFRTSWVYGARGGNFARTMLRLAQAQERLTVINDQFGAPTGADLLADVSAHAIRQVLQRPQDAGLYHVAAGGETSWHGYAKHVLARASLTSIARELVAKEVLPVASSAFPTLARRPHNSRLDTTRLHNVFGLNLPPWEQGINRMLAEILPTD